MPHVLHFRRQRAAHCVAFVEACLCCRAKGTFWSYEGPPCTCTTARQGRCARVDTFRLPGVWRPRTAAQAAQANGHALPSRRGPGPKYTLRTCVSLRGTSFAAHDVGIVDSERLPASDPAPSLQVLLFVMYIENWESFYQQALQLYRSNPVKARYVTKYRHCDGKLVLKVTDDATVSCTKQWAHALAALPVV